MELLQDFLECFIIESLNEESILGFGQCEWKVDTIPWCEGVFADGMSLVWTWGVERSQHALGSWNE